MAAWSTSDEFWAAHTAFGADPSPMTAHELLTAALMATEEDLCGVDDDDFLDAVASVRDWLKRVANGNDGPGHASQRIH